MILGVFASRKDSERLITKLTANIKNSPAKNKKAYLDSLNFLKSIKYYGVEAGKAYGQLPAGGSVPPTYGGNAPGPRHQIPFSPLVEAPEPLMVRIFMVCKPVSKEGMMGKVTQPKKHSSALAAAPI